MRRYDKLHERANSRVANNATAVQWLFMNDKMDYGRMQSSARLRQTELTAGAVNKSAK